MANVYLMLSVAFICKWLMVLSVVAAVAYVAWQKRCLVLRHAWSCRTRDHACGSRIGKLYLVTCDRCGEAHLKYLPWWSPNAV